MGKVEHSIEVHVPVTTVYNQWTQFEEFPKFMEAVKEVRQIDDDTLEWAAEINGKVERWTAKIGEQEPDERITWHSTNGPQNAGGVWFDRLDENTTRVHLRMDWRPEGVTETIGDVLGFDDRMVKGDLERFKDFIESEHKESGSWRGEIKHGDRVS
jgi:uncharacterized membrane protein